MLVTGLDEVLSASGEGLTPDASCAPEKSQERESVENAYIGTNRLLTSVTTLGKSAKLSDYRRECLNGYLSLYPEEAKVARLPKSECYPWATESDEESEFEEDSYLRKYKDDYPVTGLYQKMKLPRESAKRISMFEKDLKKQWYVFRLNYGRNASALDSISIPDCDFYIPSLKRCVKVKGEKLIICDPYLKNFFFAFTTRRIAGIIHESPLVPYVRLYYNHFQVDPQTGRNPPLTIPHLQMLDFMLIAEAKSFDMRILEPGKVKIPKEVFVEVIKGPFKGVQGLLTHVAGKQRVVSDSGFCIIATGYISSYDYRIIEKK